MLDWSKANVVEAAVEGEIGQDEGRVGEEGGKAGQIKECLRKLFVQIQDDKSIYKLLVCPIFIIFGIRI